MLRSGCPASSAASIALRSGCTQTVQGLPIALSLCPADGPHPRAITAPWMIPDPGKTQSTLRYEPFNAIGWWARDECGTCLLCAPVPEKWGVLSRILYRKAAGQAARPNLKEKAAEHF